MFFPWVSVCVSTNIKDSDWLKITYFSNFMDPCMPIKEKKIRHIMHVNENLG